MPLNNLSRHHLHQHVSPDEDGHDGEHLPDRLRIARRAFLREAVGIGGAALAITGLAYQESSHHPMTPEKKRAPNIGREDLATLLQERLHWSTFEKICEQGCHCVDGRCREQKGVAGVPGGDAGVLIAALSAVEKITGQQVPPDVMERVMMQMPGRFYMHTDEEKGMHHIEEAIFKSPRLSQYAKNHHEAHNIIMHGIPAGANDAVAEKELLDLVTKAENQGCGHLSNMQINEGIYRTKSQYVSDILAMTFRHVWKGDTHETIDPLKGKHNEGAVVQVEIDGGTESINADTEFPVLQPCDTKGLQFFTLHPQVGNKRLAEVRDILVKELGIPFDPVALQREAEVLLAHQTGITRETLAKRRPLYVLHANPKTKTWTMEERGLIS